MEIADGAGWTFVLKNKGFNEDKAEGGFGMTMTASGAAGHGRASAKRGTAGCVDQRGVVAGSGLTKTSVGRDG